jgi:hypothetical protein
MKSAMTVKPDVVVNVAILLTCAFVCVGIVRQFSHSAGASVDRKLTVFAPGDTADSLPGIRYENERATIVLYLRSTCKYCTESMAFYRLLMEHVGKRPGIHLVVATGEPTEVARSYLSSHDLKIDDVVQSRLSSVPTPTVVVIDLHGKVKQAWVGQQKPAGETEMLRAIGAI